jgi:hypothetical protein
VTVLTKHEHGWWFGQIGEKQGYFPKNYVKKREPEESSADTPPIDDSPDSDLDTVIVEAIVRPFGITSLPAFDELVDNGIAVEVISPSTVEPVIPISIGKSIL